nr:polymorphic toxin type 17 domain-containing protein [Variovorax sp. PBS-H4]
MGLPSTGRIRFVPPTNYNPASPLPRGPQNGFVDRFGNEWVAGPSRTAGHPFEWDVQLSPTGREQIGWLSRDGRHVNVSPFGEVTHR